MISDDDDFVPKNPNEKRVNNTPVQSWVREIQTDAHELECVACCVGVSHVKNASCQRAVKKKGM